MSHRGEGKVLCKMIEFSWNNTHIECHGTGLSGLGNVVEPSCVVSSQDILVDKDTKPS